MSDKSIQHLANIMCKVSATGALAQLREITPQITDRNIARPIYTELLRLAKQMSEKHDFAYHKHAGGEK